MMPGFSQSNQASSSADFGMTSNLGGGLNIGGLQVGNESQSPMIWVLLAFIC